MPQLTIEHQVRRFPVILDRLTAERGRLAELVLKTIFPDMECPAARQDRLKLPQHLTGVVIGQRGRCRNGRYIFGKEPGALLKQSNLSVDETVVVHLQLRIIRHRRI